jgi:hypothetical protein
VPNGTACQCNSRGGPVAGISFNLQQAGQLRQAPAQGQPGQSRDGKDRNVVVINATNVVVNSFYASNVNRSDWEEDMLGRNVLAPGRRVKANIDDGTGACLFDFKVVFADGRSMEDRRVNVCQIASWIITPQGPRQQLPQQPVPQRQVPQQQLPQQQVPQQQVPQQQVPPKLPTGGGGEPGNNTDDCFRGLGNCKGTFSR